MFTVVSFRYFYFLNHPPEETWKRSCWLAKMTINAMVFTNRFFCPALHVRPSTNESASKHLASRTSVLNWKRFPLKNHQFCKLGTDVFFSLIIPYRKICTTRKFFFIILKHLKYFDSPNRVTYEKLTKNSYPSSQTVILFITCFDETCWVIFLKFLINDLISWYFCHFSWLLFTPFKTFILVLGCLQFMTALNVSWILILMCITCTF